MAGDNTMLVSKNFSSHLISICGGSLRLVDNPTQPSNDSLYAPRAREFIKFLTVQVVCLASETPNHLGYPEADRTPRGIFQEPEAPYRENGR